MCESGTTIGFAHEALFYDGTRAFNDAVIPFVEEGVARGESVLVALPAVRLAPLQQHFTGDRSGLLSFAEMEDIGRNPARIIPAWASFLAEDRHGRGADRVGWRGVGEPAWSGRSPDELDECSRHESLLNLAFADAERFTLLCPYDARALAGSVLDDARRNHPVVCEHGVAASSGTFAATVPPWPDAPLRPAPARATVSSFDVSTLRQRRHDIAGYLELAGFGGPRGDDLTVALSEAMTNSIQHGGGGGELAWWAEGDSFLCDVRDRGRITDPLAGRVRPTRDQVGGRGLWIINQLCDLVQLRVMADGQVVRLHLRR